MTLRFTLRPGESIFDQVVYAAQKAFVSGEFLPGQPFPSVRALAADLKIHPNTAHKVIQYLIQERFLEARPGVGTVVAQAPTARSGDRKRLMQQEVEQLVVEAKRIGVDLKEVMEAIEAQWTRLEKPAEVEKEMIEIENLWKNFGRHDALRGLSLQAPEGSAYALIGANGAGKTTTIKVLMNIITATQGRASVMGVDSRSISPRELSRIGYVSESQDMPGALTVDAYLDYLRPFYPEWDRDLETSIRQEFRLPAGRKIRDLSHGMRIKMALLCALSYRPKLLILDEPFSGLDPLVREEFMEGLLAQAGDTTILISTHELGEIEGVATHVGFLDEGKLLFEQPLEDLKERFRQVRVTLDREATVPAKVPPEWLAMRAIGSVLTFVDSRFSEREIGDRVRSEIGAIEHIDAQSMTLRSIFTTLARAARDGGL